MRFYVNKVEFVISFSFLLIIAFAILSNCYNLLYVIFFSSLHEMGHLVLLYALGGRAKQIKLSYYGVALLRGNNLSNLREIIFLLGGIGVNLLFALLNVQKNVNLALFAVNSLPVYPLDGGRILKLLLNQIFCLNVSDGIFKVFGIVAIFLMLFFSVYLKNISLLLIAIYVIVYSFNNTTD